MADERLTNRLTDLKLPIKRLREAIDEWNAGSRPIIRDAVVMRFEFSVELAWKATRDWLHVWEPDVSPNGRDRPSRLALSAVSSPTLIGGR